MGARHHILTQDERTLLVRTVEEAGKVVAGYFGMPLERQVKGIDADYSTRADRESEKHITAVLRTHFPHIGMLGEEYGETKTESGLCFILDPIDGTHTFGIGYPVFSISLALMDGDESVFGIVHEPISGWTYVAARGEGATRNGKRIHVNANTDVAHAVFGYSQGWNTREKTFDEIPSKVHQALYDAERHVRMWSPACDLSRVAEGFITAFLCVRPEIYDVAAGVLIVREAGGKITNLQGDSTRSDRELIFLASNGTAIHDEILHRIRGIIPA